MHPGTTQAGGKLQAPSSKDLLPPPTLNQQPLNTFLSKEHFYSFCLLLKPPLYSYYQYGQLG